MGAGRPSSKRRLTDDEKARIVAAIRAGEPRNDIARRFHRSQGTVSRLAAEHGLSFDRSITKDATEAKVVDNRARRTRIAERLLEEAERCLDDMHSPAEVVNWHQGRANILLRAEPTYGDRKQLMVAVAIALEKNVELERIDSADEEQVKGAIRTLMEQVRANAS